MNARLLFEIALRVTGLWFVLVAVSNLLVALQFFLLNFASNSRPDLLFMAAVTAGSFAVQILFGGLIVWLAPHIAAWFYRPGHEGGELQVSVGPGDVYRTACFVLGVYLLVEAAYPAAQFLITGFRRDGGSEQLVVYAISTTVSLGSGLLLVFGSRRIAEILSNLRYDPDTIPAQRFSIAVLFVVIAIIAVVLGVLRAR